MLRTGLPLAKLHGSIAGSRIVPPTWNKSFHPEILGTWKLAHRLLSEATHVRVIGYSLPESDAYVRFLLKSAVLRSERLKSIHVICKDPDGSVERRYRSFVTFPRFRFSGADTLSYLNGLGAIVEQQTSAGRERVWVQYCLYLERHHAKFFDEG
jgi:hypothetical protein